MESMFLKLKLNNVTSLQSLCIALRRKPEASSMVCRTYLFWTLTCLSHNFLEYHILFPLKLHTCFSQLLKDISSSMLKIVEHDVLSAENIPLSLCLTRSISWVNLWNVAVKDISSLSLFKFRLDYKKRRIKNFYPVSSISVLFFLTALD